MYLLYVFAILYFCSKSIECIVYLVHLEYILRHIIHMAVVFYAINTDSDHSFDILCINCGKKQRGLCTHPDFRSNTCASGCYVHSVFNTFFECFEQNSIFPNVFCIAFKIMHSIDKYGFVRDYVFKMYKIANTFNTF